MIDAADHLPLVASSVARFYRRGLPTFIDRDDLYGAGVVGLMDAAARFDPSNGARFEWYAAIRIRGAIVDELRRIGRATRNTVAPSEENEKLVELVRDGSTLAREEMGKRESAAAVRACLEMLPDRERDVITLYYFDGVNGPEIGRRLGVTKQAIFSIMQAAHERLRAWLSTGPDAVAA